MVHLGLVFLCGAHALVSLSVPRCHMRPPPQQTRLSSLHSEETLHQIARRAIQRGLHSDALMCYDRAIVAPPVECSGRTFLLLALQLQRMSEFELARVAFSEGIVHFKSDAKLMQAWGLFESKQGNMDRAKRLLHRAVALDPSLAAVLRWKLFREPQQSSEACGRAYATMRRRVERHPPIAAIGISESMTKLVTPPMIRYTVPSQNIGWRGRALIGEDPALWYDAEGVREAPPMNYWRQRADERFYVANMAVVEALRSGAPIDEALAPLEQRMPVAKPYLNRKLIGIWAPLMLGGNGMLGDESAAANVAGSEEGLLAVGATLELRRAGAPETETTRYGTFDKHLEPGEAMLLTFSPAAGDMASHEMGASRTNERRPLPFTHKERLQLGGITFLSEYLLVQRDMSGATDVWMRVGGSESWAVPAVGPLSRTTSPAS